MALSNEQWNAPSGGGDFFDHQIAHSCRFKSATSDDLHRTFGTSSDLAKFTFSCWVKRSLTYANGGNTEWQNIIGNTTGVDGGGAAFGFESGGGTSGGLNNRDRIAWYGLAGAGGGNNGGDDRIAGYFYDTSAWYHIVVRVDTGQNAATKIRYYVNGDLKARTATNEPTGNMSRFNTATVHYIGALANGNYDLDALLAEVIFTDGQSYAPTQFGETKNGVWIPKDASGSTFGTNGFHLNFANASALGNDVSGNNNDWTVANLTAHDQMLDSPTFGDGSNGGNFCTINPMAQQGGSTIDRSGDLSEGNLLQVLSGSESGPTATMGFNSTSGGKWYWEVHINTFKAGGIIGIVNEKFNIDSEICYNSPGSPTGADAIGIYFDTGNVYAGVQDGGTSSGYGDQLANGDVIGVAVDVDNAKIWFSKNGTFYNSGNPANGGAAARGAGGTITTAMDFSRTWFPVAGNWSAANGLVTWNFGQEGTFAGAETAGGNADDNGFGNFFTSPPSGYLALCSGNLPVAEKVDPAQTNDNFPQELFNPYLYTGNATDNRNLTGMGFQPDWCWIKDRASAEGHQVYDSSRGVEKRIQINTTGAEEATSDKFQAFLSDGFQVGASNDTNKDSSGFVSWSWRVNGGSLTANDDGNATTQVQTDPSGALSLVKYTGTANALTVGHGLSVEPKLTIVKDRDATVDWVVYTKLVDGTLDYFLLNTNAAKGNSGLTGPNASIWNFQVESGYSNTANRKYIMYNFANVEGYCKVGSYEGNGNADGVYVYTGFSPAFVICKSADSTSDWQIFDNKREGYNVDNDALIANDTTVEATADNIDLLSNGFKFRVATDPNVAETYVYLAFAHNPLKYATARG